VRDLIINGDIHIQVDAHFHDKVQINVGTGRAHPNSPVGRLDAAVPAIEHQLGRRLSAHEYGQLLGYAIGARPIPEPAPTRLAQPQPQPRSLLQKLCDR